MIILELFCGEDEPDILKEDWRQCFEHFYWFVQRKEVKKTALSNWKILFKILPGLPGPSYDPCILWWIKITST